MPIVEEYTSHNTDRLDIKEMVQLLKKLKFVKALEKGIEIDAEEA